jgi:hypothetical protein
MQIRQPLGSHANAQSRCHDLVLKLLNCFALAMGLQDCNYFAAAHQEDSGNGNSLRMLLYLAHDERPEGTRMIEYTGS